MAHDKVYCFCENMCAEETLTKVQIEALVGSSSGVVSGDYVGDGQIAKWIQLDFRPKFVIVFEYGYDDEDVPYFAMSMNSTLIGQDEITMALINSAFKYNSNISLRNRDGFMVRNEANVNLKYYCYIAVK